MQPFCNLFLLSFTSQACRQLFLYVHCCIILGYVTTPCVWPRTLLVSRGCRVVPALRQPFPTTFPERSRLEEGETLTGLKRTLGQTGGVSRPAQAHGRPGRVPDHSPLPPQSSDSTSKPHSGPHQHYSHFSKRQTSQRTRRSSKTI